MVPKPVPMMFAVVGEVDLRWAAGLDRGLRSLNFFHSGESRVMLNGRRVLFLHALSMTWTCVAVAFGAVRFYFCLCFSKPEL